MIKHKIVHQYQLTNTSCSQTALSILLSFFDQQISPEEIIKGVPEIKNDQGEDWGTINQQIATWCISRGFKVDMFTSDFQIIDSSWAALEANELLDRMEKAKDFRDIPSLGKQTTELYLQSYIDFIKAGGKLHIYPYFTTKIINNLLGQSPLLISVCYNVLYDTGRTKEVELRKTGPDDLNGDLMNHSVVLYGIDENGNYLIADPWREPGLITIDPERLLSSMTASLIYCDNLFFQLSK